MVTETGHPPLRLVHVINTLRRESGGPSEAVRSCSLALARLGHDVQILTLDPPEDWSEPSTLVVHPLGVRPVGYGSTPRLADWLQEHRSRFDAVLVHGLWQFQSWGTYAALRAQQVPFLVFSHGMLDPWFRRTYPLKHAKKQLYWWLREYRVLRAAAAVCFTCEEERRLARQSFWPYRVREQVLAFGTADPGGDTARQIGAWQRNGPELHGRPYLLFLGRIHPKKGIDVLLRAYGQTLAKAPEAAPALVIAGPGGDTAYGETLRRLAARVCPANAVVWPGMLSGDVKWGAIRACEAFCLTSHQENFGIAVAEALACGRPVLLSHEVNIWREVIADGAGLAAADTVAGAVEMLSRWADLSGAERLAMGQAARGCFTRRYEIMQAAQSLVETVRAVLPPAAPAGEANR